jgi:hypothetical protein
LGCMCDYVPAWAIPQHRELVTELTEDTPAMRGVRILAELDDAAGRRATSAQRERGQRERILALQQGWLERT